ncbi:MAG: acyl-CoA reductase, partial [bacterium]
MAERAAAFVDRESVGRDLGRDASRSPRWLFALRRAARHLKKLPVSQILHQLDITTSAWLIPDSQYRRLAAARVSSATGYPRSVIEDALIETFSRLRAPVLNRLLKAELGDPRMLDTFVRYPGGRIHAVGPDLMLQIYAGNIPGPPVLTLAYGLLAKSAIIGKVAAEEPILAPLFLKSLREFAPALGACVRIMAWRGGDESIESALYKAADLVVAFGSDATIRSIRDRLPAHTRFIAYGHRISFG